MTDAGRAVLPDMGAAGFTIDPDILRELQADPALWENFRRLPELYRRVRIDTIQIKRSQPELFRKRLDKFLENTRRGILYGEWNDSGRLWAEDSEMEPFVLRPWHESDAPAQARYLNNRKIWDNCRDGLPYPYTEEDALRFIRSASEQEGSRNYCIEIRQEAAGNIGFIRGTDVERYNAEVGYWLAEPYWNRGIMSRALKEAVGEYLRQTDAVRIHARVHAGNRASMRVPSVRHLAQGLLQERAVCRLSLLRTARVTGSPCMRRSPAAFGFGGAQDLQDTPRREAGPLRRHGRE